MTRKNVTDKDSLRVRAERERESVRGERRSRMGGPEVGGVGFACSWVWVGVCCRAAVCCCACVRAGGRGCGESDEEQTQLLETSALFDADGVSRGVPCERRWCPGRHNRVVSIVRVVSPAPLGACRMKTEDRGDEEEGGEDWNAERERAKETGGGTQEGRACGGEESRL